MTRDEAFGRLLELGVPGIRARWLLDEARARGSVTGDGVTAAFHAGRYHVGEALR